MVTQLSSNGATKCLTLGSSDSPIFGNVESIVSLQCAREGDRWETICVDRPRAVGSAPMVDFPHRVTRAARSILGVMGKSTFHHHQDHGTPELVVLYSPFKWKTSITLMMTDAFLRCTLAFADDLNLDVLRRYVREERDSR